MTSRDFAYWLQGYFELNGICQLTKEQSQVIQNHLNLVFQHEIDPSIHGNNSEKMNALNAIHEKPSTIMKQDANREEIRIRC